VENKAYLLWLAWDFAYNNMSWSILMRVISLKSNYLKIPYHSSSIWHDINEYYDILLDNKLLCYSKCIYLIVGVPYLERISLISTIVNGWNNSGSYISFDLGRNPDIHSIKHLIISYLLDVPNWRM